MISRKVIIAIVLILAIGILVTPKVTHAKIGFFGGRITAVFEVDELGIHLMIIKGPPNAIAVRAGVRIGACIPGSWILGWGVVGKYGIINIFCGCVP